MFLKEKRKSLSLTQNDIAEKLNVSQQAVAKWEAEKSKPNIAQLINLSKLFNCTIDELLLGEKIAKYELQQIISLAVSETIKQISPSIQPAEPDINNVIKSEKIQRDYLIILRKKSGFKQNEIANKLGISESYYSTIEHGKRNKVLSVVMLQKLSDIFKISIQELINEEMLFSGRIK